jgi:hypothetical protein
MEAPVRSHNGIKVRMASWFEEIWPDRGEQEDVAKRNNSDKAAYEGDEEDVGEHRCNSVA